MERGGPVWPGVYGAGSSLQHAAQLQLLSQQQMLRQQELLMIQQRTAHVLELQRNAQLVVSAGVHAHTRTHTDTTVYKSTHKDIKYRRPCGVFMHASRQCTQNMRRLSCI